MKLYRKDDLKDARIFFEKEPFSFTSWLLVLSLVLIVATLIASMYLQTGFLIYAEGEVIDQNITYGSSQSSALVAVVYKEEGDYVIAGDIIVLLDQATNEEQALVKQISLLEAKQEMMKRFETSIEVGVNYMKNEGIEQGYFGKVSYFLIQKQSEDIIRSVVQKELDNKLSEQAKLKYELLYQEDEQLMQELKGIEQDVSALKQQLVTLQDSEKLKAQLISELGDSKLEVEKQLLETQTQLDKIVSEKQIVAKTSGKIHFVSVVQAGIQVNQGQVLFEIKDTSNPNLEVYVPLQEHSKLKLKQSVYVRLEDNQIRKGVIEVIDDGSVMREVNGQNIPFVHCRVKMDTMKDLKHTQVISVEIMYEQSSYMNYFLKLMNFK